MFTRRLCLGASLALTVAILVACVGRVTTQLPAYLAAPQEVAQPDGKLPKCKGQKDTKQYASLVVKLSMKGGLICIPEFGGFGGTIQYPSAGRSAKLMLISSTTDYNGMPQLFAPQVAIYYLQLKLLVGATFKTGDRAGAELWSKKLDTSGCYLTDSLLKISGMTYMPGFFRRPVKGKYGGMVGDFGKVRKSATIASHSTALIEVYSMQPSSQC
jgi:hypothetical protein